VEKITKSLKPVEVEYQCDSCENGYMHPTGSINSKGENQGFEHKCTNCGELKYFDIKYPTVKYIWKDILS
jgi:uncharacterized Zn finger protein